MSESAEFHPSNDPADDAVVTKRLFTIAETAIILNVSRSTVYKLVQDGLLRAIKLGISSKCAVRIPGEDIDRLINTGLN